MGCVIAVASMGRAAASQSPVLEYVGFLTWGYRQASHSAVALERHKGLDIGYRYQVLMTYQGSHVRFAKTAVPVVVAAAAAVAHK